MIGLWFLLLMLRIFIRLVEAKARIRRMMFKQYGITLSRMKFEKSINDIDYYRSNRVEN